MGLRSDWREERIPGEDGDDSALCQHRYASRGVNREYGAGGNHGALPKGVSGFEKTVFCGDAD